MRFQLDYPPIYDNYQTRNEHLTWFSRTFPSLAFYKRMSAVVMRGAELAKKDMYSDKEWCTSSFNILRAIESIGTKVTIENLKLTLDLKEPSVIVGNHMSTLETFLLPYMLSPHMKVTFVIKEALVSYPIFKHIMISRNPIIVGRESPKKDFIKVLSEGVNRIKEGYTVIVFPQTTRMKVFEKSKFNSIGIKLAKRANVPVIPLALKTDCWRNGKIIKDFGKIDPRKSVHFKFGTPLKIEDNGKNQQESVIKHIEDCLSQWTDRIPALEEK
ncbi:MAG: lysophospholipid acyltransferase family protein [Verrucomicrobia bacterium]|nr:lysophospholipid acyltransferase family protein [Verrucomicrobiota bacterium]MDA1067935.1 lysophospholipid acyltransferase family protein [Verrucomicrobiota bacterium]